MQSAPSISRQLSIGLLASLLLAVLLLGVVATLLFERALRQYALAGLHDEAHGVLAAIAAGTDGLQLDSARLSRVYAKPLSGRYFVVELDGQRWRSRSLWDAELPSPTQAGAVPGLVDGPQGQKLLCLRADFRRQGQSIRIVVAADIAPLLQEFGSIGLLLAGLACLVLVLLIWVQGWWLRRALHPLRRAQEQLQELRLGKRELLQQEAPRELQPLIAEINHLLSHTRESLLRSRHALGNLGHSLKTPLAVLLALSGRADGAIRPQMQQQLGLMQHRIGRELGRARTAGEALGATWFVPADELPLLTDSLRRAHPRDLRIEWDAPDTALALERDDMLELLGNLLDNACKWARSRVVLRIEQQPQAVRMRIEDDGPGIADELRALALTRGGRLDEEVEGHGLGLGIVVDIVAAYRGRIDLRRSPLGGLLVELELPLALRQDPG
jgi:signal transduction histidine kinase